MAMVCLRVKLRESVMTNKFLGRYLATVLSLLLLWVPVGGSEDWSSAVKVELVKEKPLWLHVTLRCHSKTRVTFSKYQLPWGNYNSMEFVAVTPDEHYVERIWPTDDPTFEQISTQPNESRSGDVDLRMKFIGLDAVLKKSPVHLFWAYRAPKELNISEWPGGMIIIPQQK
jgi:hypothetical protein